MSAARPRTAFTAYLATLSSVPFTFAIENRYVVPASRMNRLVGNPLMMSFSFTPPM